GGGTSHPPEGERHSPAFEGVYEGPGKQQQQDGRREAWDHRGTSQEVPVAVGGGRSTTGAQAQQGPGEGIKESGSIYNSLASMGSFRKSAFALRWDDESVQPPGGRSESGLGGTGSSSASSGSMGRGRVSGILRLGGAPSPHGAVARKRGGLQRKPPSEKQQRYEPFNRAKTDLNLMSVEQLVAKVQELERNSASWRLKYAECERKLRNAYQALERAGLKPKEDATEAWIRPQVAGGGQHPAQSNSATTPPDFGTGVNHGG
ncbi:unnamed protein product, partial [Discosporangium mesarthrocarpum]